MGEERSPKPRGHHGEIGGVFKRPVGYPPVGGIEKFAPRAVVLQFAQTVEDGQ